MKMVRMNVPTVSFRESCDSVALVPSHIEMSDDARRALWYSEEENDDIMMDNVRTIKAIRKRENSSNLRNRDDNEICTRGLEALICRKALEQRKMSKKFAVSSVLSEQERQEQMGIYYPEEIRRSSMRLTVSSVSRAVSSALDDAAFVRREIAATVRTMHEQQGLSSLKSRPAAERRTQSHVTNA